MADTVATALRDAARRLDGVGDAARIEAEWLMAHALGCSRSDLLLRHMADPAPASFAALVSRRAKGEPLAHITQSAEFYGLTLTITPDVLVPRGDTEALIDIAAAHFAVDPPRRILDLGTGSGALLLAALDLWPHAHGIGLERSGAALGVARRNAQALGMAPRADMRGGDWTLPGWNAGLGRFDCILANPPYIAPGDPELAPGVLATEPYEALFAARDGLADYHRLVPAMRELLCEGGLAVFEIGWRQAAAVCALGRENGLETRVHNDLAGRPRAVTMWNTP